MTQATRFKSTIFREQKTSAMTEMPDGYFSPQTLVSGLFLQTFGYFVELQFLYYYIAMNFWTLLRKPVKNKALKKLPRTIL